MAHGTSGLLSLVFTILLIAAMQVFRSHLASSQAMTLLGGFAGSNIFVFLMTAMSNFEMETFGNGYKAGFFPEVIIALSVASLSSASVHRVCMTTCIIFSAVYLYVLNGISNAKYSPPTTGAPTGAPMKKKK